MTRSGRIEGDAARMGLQVNTLTVDCRRPRAIAAFWSEALDWPIVHDGDDTVLIAPFEEHRPGVTAILFQTNPDEKRIKNRWHLDLAPDDQAVEVRRLEGMGARRVDIGQGEVDWVVMADPEGNEFCVLRSLPAASAAG